MVGLAIHAIAILERALLLDYEDRGAEHDDVVKVIRTEIAKVGPGPDKRRLARCHRLGARFN
jgi:hypothetical protein